jgi:hypothetical protein
MRVDVVVRWVPGTGTPRFSDEEEIAVTETKKRPWTAPRCTVLARSMTDGAAGGGTVSAETYNACRNTNLPTNSTMK